MSITVKKLYQANENPFQLTLCAGRGGERNIVTWIYMLEDEYIIPYFHGAELAVTTGMKTVDDQDWLLVLVQRLLAQHAAGLIVNVGKFIFDIPKEVKEFCDIHDFPLFTMPWEIKITEMTQEFCLAIINERHESLIHDKAVRDAILNHDNVQEYTDTLARYYDLEGHFSVIAIYMRYQSEDGTADGEDAGSQLNTEYWLETRLRRLKTKMHMPKTRIGVVSHENMHLLIINNGTPDMHQRIQEIIQEIYLDKLTSRRIFIGVGIEVVGLSALGKSYNRAVTAMRMAVYQDKPVIRFEEMGFYKILFSVKDDEVLYAYADEMLAPLDAYDAKNHNYIEFLQAYIQNDRSLEHTAQSLFLHRNTVNYRLQKMKELLHSPLKTVEDLFPYQVALAIRDMQNQRILLGSQNEEQTGGTKE